MTLVATDGSKCDNSNLPFENRGVTDITQFSTDGKGSCHSINRLPQHILEIIISNICTVDAILFQSTCKHFRKAIVVDRGKLDICMIVHLQKRIQKAALRKRLYLGGKCKTTPKVHRQIGDPPRLVMEGTPTIVKRLNYQRSADRRIRSRANFDHRFHVVLGMIVPKSSFAEMIARSQFYRFVQVGKLICYGHLVDSFQPTSTSQSITAFIKLPGDKPGWLLLTILRCSHCGRCISEGDSRRTGCKDCKCNYCYRLADFHLFRVGPDRLEAAAPSRLVHGGIFEGTGRAEKKVPFYFAREGRFQGKDGQNYRCSSNHFYQVDRSGLWPYLRAAYIEVKLPYTFAFEERLEMKAIDKKSMQVAA